MTRSYFVVVVRIAIAAVVVDAAVDAAIISVVVDVIGGKDGDGR